MVCAGYVHLLHTAQTSGPSRPIAVLKIVIIVGVFGIASDGSSSFGHARRREGIRGRNNWRYERVSVAS